MGTVRFLYATFYASIIRYTGTCFVLSRRVLSVLVRNTPPHICCHMLYMLLVEILDDPTSFIHVHSSGLPHIH